MKRVIYTDDRGFLRCVLLRDSDDERNVKAGIPLEPPPITELLPDIEKTLHNELVSRGLLSWDDVMRSQNGLSAAILSAVRPVLQSAYKEKGVKNAG